MNGKITYNYIWLNKALLYLGKIRGGGVVEGCHMSAVAVLGTDERIF